MPRRNASSNIGLNSSGFCVKKPEVSGLSRIRCEQGRAARTERTVENHFDRALREMVIKCVQGRSVFQQCVGGFARTVSRIVNAQLHFVRVEGASDDCLIRQFTAGVLNFAPAEFDLAIDVRAATPARVSASVGFGNFLRDQILRVIEQHSVWIAASFFKISSAEWIWRVIVDVRRSSARRMLTTAA